MTTIRESMREILEIESQAILSIPITDDYEDAINLIIERVHHHHGKLVTTGMGKAGQIAMNIAATFSSTGTPALFMHPSEAQHGDIGVLQPNDVMLLVSNSGETREILEIIGLSHRLIPDLPMIAITGNPDSPLAKACNIVLITSDAPEVCPLGLTPTTSTTMMSVIGDVLVANTTRITGFTRHEYSKRHHGGYLGHISRTTPHNE